MPWFKVKSLNYIPTFRGMENFIISAIVEFGMTIDGVDQSAFAEEIDLLKGATFSGTFKALSELTKEDASQYVIEILGVDEIERLKLKAEINFQHEHMLFLGN